MNCFPGGAIVRKVFLIFFCLFLFVGAAVVVGGGVYIGDYFVDYVLKSEVDAGGRKAPPAYASFGSRSTARAEKPRYAHEPWTLKSLDGFTLRGTYFQPPMPGHNWVILVHGYGGDESYMWSMAGTYLQEGYNVLTINQRASGTSEGTYVTMGVLESRDVGEWVKKLTDFDPGAQIVLHGVSMGAATVLMCSNNPELKQVVAVVADSSYSSAYDIFEEKLSQAVEYPASPLLLCANLMTRYRTGVFLKDADPLKSVKASYVPVLLMHGGSDKLVPITMEKELYEATNAPYKEIVVVPGAQHGMAYAEDSNLYFGKVFTFLARFRQ